MPESNTGFVKRLRTEPYSPKWKHVLIIRTEDRDNACNLIEQADKKYDKDFRAIKSLNKALMSHKNAQIEQAEALQTIHTDQIEAMAVQIEQQQKCIGKMLDICKHLSRAGTPDYPNDSASLNVAAAIPYLIKMAKDIVSEAEEMLK